MVGLVECIDRVGKTLNSGHFEPNFQQVEVHVNFEDKKVKVKCVDYVGILLLYDEF